MKTPIDIQSRRFSLTRALRRHVERRLQFISGRHYEDIRRVMVRLSDANGPRGGIDKCCLIEVQLPGRKAVVVTDTRGDLYAAIDIASTRARQVIGRHLGRRQRKASARITADRQLADGLAFG